MKNTFIGFVISIVLMSIGCSNQPAPATKTSNKSTTQPIDQKTPSEEATKKKTIVFFGNSLSAGYGLDPSQGFVGLVKQRIDSLNLGFKVINAGLSGETTAGGNNRVDWILDRQPVDIFVLELGGNDMLRGVSHENSYENLQAIITKVKTKYPSAKIVLAGMLAPPNMGPNYIKGFNGMYPKLAKRNDAVLIPFLLDKVGGISSLNLPDGIHPNVEGHKIVLENVWTILEPLL